MQIIKSLEQGLSIFVPRYDFVDSEENEKKNKKHYLKP